MTVKADIARTVAVEPGLTPDSTGGSAWPMSNILGPLGALPTAPGLARRYTTVVLAGWGLSAIAADAELLVSELTTNVVGAATGPGGTPRYDDQGGLPVVWLRLLSDHTWLLIQAWDNLPEAFGMPVVRRAGTDDETGRGLEIIESLSEQWGWGAVPGWRGKCVWALLRADPGTKGTRGDAH